MYMDDKKLHPLVASSEDPTKIADTIKGVILAGATTIILVAQLLGFNIVSEQVTDFATQISYAIAGVWTAYGLVKKLIIYLNNSLK